MATRRTLDGPTIPEPGGFAVEGIAAGRGLGFLGGGGEMGELIRARDWAATPLGPPRAWPQGLRTTVRMALTTRHPIFIFWGPEHVCLYNDGYRASLGPEKHPSVLGAPGREAWPEAWPIIGPQIGLVMRGEGATWHENEPMPFVRHGRLEEVYWTYSYGPIDDETAPSGVGGVLVVCTETTRQVLAGRRAAAERQRLADLFEQAPSFMALLGGPEHRVERANPGFLRLVGGRPVLGRTIAQALPEAVEQGYLEILDRVYRTGEAFAADGARYERAGSDGVAEERFVDFVYQPLRDGHGRVTGIFVEGHDVTGRRRAEEQRELLVAELNHRVKNTLAVVQSIARQSWRHATTPEAAREAFDGRLMALARAHDVLTREAWAGASLGEVVARAVEPYRGEAERVAVGGPEVRLRPGAALALAMALQELATNAVKHGALSAAAGRVGVSWSVDRAAVPPRLRLRWEEAGGPPVAGPPARRGFGSTLVEQGLARDLRGTVRLAFEPAGVVCTVEAPIA